MVVAHLHVIVVDGVGSGSPTAAVRSATGTGSSDSAGSSWLSPNDLGMRSDTLVSPRVSPVMQHRRVPSLVVTSTVDKSGRLTRCNGGSRNRWWRGMWSKPGDRRLRGGGEGYLYNYLDC